jgi:hypothetical protein
VGQVVHDVATGVRTYVNLVSHLIDNVWPF